MMEQDFAGRIALITGSSQGIGYELARGLAGAGAEVIVNGLNRERLDLADKNCVVLHPGPMNRGVEISSEVADSPQSLIRRQVRNGLHTRMALLLTLTRAQA